MQYEMPALTEEQKEQLINFIKDEHSMKLKKKVADAFVSFTHEWNVALHDSIEKNVFAAYAETFPNEMKDPKKAGDQIDSMRRFYYQRMINTSSLLLAAASVLIAAVALIIAVIALCIS